MVLLKRAFAFLGLFSALFAIVQVSAGQDGKKAKDDKKDPQSAVEPKSGPGEGQKFLARMEGDWIVDKTFYSRTPGAPPAKTQGTCRQTMTHGGRFLKSEFDFQNKDGESTGTGVIGFEPGNGIFTSTWFDSRQTKMSIRRSNEPFDQEKIVLFGVPLGDPKENRKSKTITTISPDSKTITHKQFSIAQDGTERLIMVLEMKKKGS